VPLAFGRIVVADIADMLLFVKLDSDALDEIKLGFEEVDVMLLVLHDALEQVTRNVVLDAVAVGRPS